MLVLDKKNNADQRFCCGKISGSSAVKPKDVRKGPFIKPNRMKVVGDLPTQEELIKLKQRKRVYQTGTEYFNQKPTKGIAYLQEQGLLSDPWTLERL